MTDPIFEQEKPSLLGRILPPIILISVFGGFVSLAIYAYQAGRQSVPEGELMVVEADKAPMKEKPQDPGGMEFPNQDKTIFETFAGSESTEAKVERVLPNPEEPIAPVASKEAVETTTWINNKLAPAADGKPEGVEQVIGAEDAVATDTSPANQGPKVVNIQEELGKQAVNATAPIEPAVTATRPVTLTPKTETPKDVAEAPVAAVETTKPAEKKEPFAPEKIATAKKPEQPKKPERPKEPTLKSAAGKQMVQLGAYRSDTDAKADFAKLQKKFAALGGLSPVVNRADLGEKGVFFRLRVATADAKALCAKLAGQACMVVKQ